MDPVRNPAVVLKSGQQKSVQSGSLWVYASQVLALVGAPEPGGIVDVVDFRNRFLGRGYYNGTSQIIVRLLTDREEPIDRAFLARRLAEAWELRARVLPDRTLCRVVFSEGDRLPGLIVDKYGAVLTLQATTLGMERLKGMIVELLVELLGPESIFERDDLPARRLEGLDEIVGPLYGPVPVRSVLPVAGLHLPVDPAAGQKTGLFLDQRLNHCLAGELCRGARVLDAFCYTGGFALRAAAGGAESVLAVDLSEAALALAVRTAEENGVAGAIEFRKENVFDLLRASAGPFDVIILDPPAFAHSRKALAGAVRGYKEINLRAMKLLAPGGLLATFSCSYHMTREHFHDLLVEAAADSRRSFVARAQLFQAPDHPIRLGHPETAYLKGFLLQAC
jgi:23S rRNA (cytosine1962-C5)-methyltransferase